MYSKMHFANLSPDGIIVVLCQIIIAVLCFGIVFFTTIWCVYFLSRVRQLSRKIHYLKKQTDERCCEELTNAKVDYVKSMFIAGIAISESFPFWFVFALVIVFNLIPQQPIGNCPGGNYLIEEIYHNYFVRGLLALELSSVLVYTSLIHTLTAYLSHAYAEKRVIRLTRGDKVLLLWLLLQLIALWISIAYWRAFILCMLALVIYLFPIHLWLYSKYSRRLYQLLKRRRLDAWYEFDPQPYKRLDGMCTEYRTGSILYISCIVTFAVLLIAIFFGGFVRTLLYDTCMMEKILFDINLNWINVSSQNQHKSIEIGFRVFAVVLNILALLSLCMFILYHLSIGIKAAKRFLKKQRIYKDYTGIRSDEMYRPLIGSK